MAEARIAISKSGNRDKANHTKIGKGKKPTVKEVEGQVHSWRGVACWNCWTVNEVVVDSIQWDGYYCWQCGTYFEV